MHGRNHNESLPVLFQKSLVEHPILDGISRGSLSDVLIFVVARCLLFRGISSSATNFSVKMHACRNRRHGMNLFLQASSYLPITSAASLPVEGRNIFYVGVARHGI